MDDERARATRGTAAVSGTIGAATALGSGELLASPFAGVPSPVVAVGDLVIDRVPLGVERAAIDIFGTADKIALVVGIVVLATGFGALLGLAARRRLDPAVVGFSAFAALGVYAAGQVTGVSLASTVVVLALAAAAGVVSVRALLRRAATGANAGQGVDAEGRASVDGVPATAGPGAGAGDRRSFVQLAGILTAGAGATALVGRQLSLRSNVAVERRAVVLPDVPSPTTAATADLGIEGLSPYLTSNDDFFRIDTALRVPQVDPATWRLRVDGHVDDPLELTYDDLLAMPQEEHVITLACVSNEVGGDLVGNARWQGVRLDALLDRVGVRPEGTQLVGRSVDGFTVGFPTGLAADGRDALVAVGMNGEPLPVLHGFPARLIVPGLYGYVSATKWLSQIELVPFDDFDAYWVPRGWSKEAPVKTQSRIDVPRSGKTVPAGTVAVAGVAWAPTRGIAAVEVRLDDGSWQEAELAGGADDDTWRQWVWQWEAEPGRHRLAVRATDGTGEVQTAQRRPVAPDGATGHHTIAVAVETG